MTRKRKIGLLAALLVVFAALQLRGLLTEDVPDAPPVPGEKAVRKGSSGPSVPDRLAGVLQLASGLPKTGVRDIFRREPERLPVPTVRPAAPRKAARPAPPPKEEIPVPLPVAAVPPPPPPELPPPEDPMVQIRKDLAAYRFVGYFRKTAGDQVLFLMKGNDVFLVKKGDVLVRGVVVSEVKEREIVLQVGPDRKARAALRDNSPLAVF